MIGRRPLLLAFGSTLLAGRADAQRRRPLLALLLTASEQDTGSNVWPLPLRRALAELGWIDGNTIDIVSRFADHQLVRLPALAAELAALQPDVVLTHGPGPIPAAAAFPASTAIVVGATSEENLLLLTGDNLARPRGNVTGLTVASREQHEKCLELLRQVEPSPVRVGVLVQAASPTYSDWPQPLMPTLQSLAMTAARYETSGRGGMEAAFARMTADGMQAVLVTANPVLNGPDIDAVMGELALQYRLPLVSTFDGVVRRGGLLSYGADYPTLVRRSAFYIDRILRGAKPSDLPAERPTVFRLTLNVKTATALGVTLPTPLLARADEVIE